MPIQVPIQRTRYNDAKGYEQQDQPSWVSYSVCKDKSFVFQHQWVHLFSSWFTTGPIVLFIVLLLKCSMSITVLFLIIFVLFQTCFQNKTVPRLQWDSSSGCLSWRRARWPLNYQLRCERLYLDHNVWTKNVIYFFVL